MNKAIMDLVSGTAISIIAGVVLTPLIGFVALKYRKYLHGKKNALYSLVNLIKDEDFRNLVVSTIVEVEKQLPIGNGKKKFNMVKQTILLAVPLAARPVVDALIQTTFDELTDGDMGIRGKKIDNN